MNADHMASPIAIANHRDAIAARGMRGAFFGLCGGLDSIRLPYSWLNYAGTRAVARVGSPHRGCTPRFALEWA